MSEIKYTTDGKKVVVIGDLNQNEKIVQEIFVTTQGDEIPQGERFVEKNLLDEPAKSWKEKRIQEIEATYEKDKKFWDDKIESLKKEKKKIYESLSAKVKWLRNVAKEPRDEQFRNIINTIADFLSDTEKWVAVKDYSTWELSKFNEDGVNSLIDIFENSYNTVSFDSMRLLSLYGGSDGNLQFKVNTYSDGSGRDSDVEFFKSEEEGLLFLQNEFDKTKEYSENNLEFAEKYNLKLDEEKLKEYNNSRKERINKYIEEAQKKLEDYKKEYESI